MSVIMVYDLETIPDVALGRKLLMAEMNDSEVAEALAQRRREQTQGSSDFLPHYLHRIVAISVVVSTPEWVKVWSLGETNSTEKELVSRFFDGIEKYTPTLVSWNGCNFDLPVLHYRAMLNGVQASRYWETGEHDPDFRWNNYINRYHQRHTDLMDVLSCYQRGAPLNEIAIMLGLPGKMGMDGKQVFNRFQSGDVQMIRDYCETDVLNTYIIYLHFCHMKGQISQDKLLDEINRLKESLRSMDKPYLNAFLAQWEATQG